MRSLLASLLLLAASLSSASAQGTIRVAYAGSMGVVMDRFLGPQFAKANGATFQGIGQGAYALAHLIAGKKLQADVFVSVTPGPVQLLEKAGLVAQAEPVASTAMVIAYNPKSHFAAALAGSTTPWWQVLESPGLRFGRTDPATDPQGQSIIFTMLLAERYYHQPGLAQKILGPNENPAQIFTEPSLLSRLEAGELDATSGYESGVVSDHLPFVTLPDEINLSNPAMQAAWYSTVHFPVTTRGKTVTLSTQPLVFYATVIKDGANPALAQKFVDFLESPAGQKAFEQNGYGKPKGGPV